MCNSFVTGFDIAVQSGPLCEEPILGSVFLIENIELLKKTQKPIVGTSPAVTGESEVVEEEKGQSDSYGPFAGQVIATVKDICKRAFLNAEPRLVEGVYLVSMHATPDAYGKIYGVINKCRGKVVKEEVQEGTNNFLIDALIPLIEGFVFNEEIRSKSCGIAYP
jgi:ribosome assembly protein 1